MWPFPRRKKVEIIFDAKYVLRNGAEFYFVNNIGNTRL